MSSIEIHREEKKTYLHRMSRENIYDPRQVSPRSALRRRIIAYMQEHCDSLYIYNQF